MIFFEVKVKYEEMNDKTGRILMKPVLYVLDAVNFTDAETKITKELIENEGIKDIEILSITKTRLEEVIGKDKDLWYFVELATLDQNGITGQEKQYISQILINSDTLIECRNKIVSLFKDTNINYIIKTIKETKIKKYINNK